MRERLQEVSVMGRLLSTQPIHCTPKPLCIVSRYILQCIAFWGIMIHSQALNSIPKRPDGSQRLSLWLWYRLGSRQPVIIAPLIVSRINIILIDVIIVVIIGELQYQSPLISWLMWPRPSLGVRTMPEIINRDRMSQIHTKNYHKYINTQQLWKYTMSKPQFNERKSRNLQTNLLNVCIHTSKMRMCARFRSQIRPLKVGIVAARGFNCKALLTRHHQLTHFDEWRAVKG